MITEH